MPVNTSIPPYYDDYSEDKDYLRVLFKPGYPVQARELTQSQTILQNQVKRIGDYLFTSGDKVSGAKPSLNLNVRTIRLRDTTADGLAVNLNNLLGKYVISPDSEILGKVEFVNEKDNPSIGDSKSIVISLKRFDSINKGLFAQGTTLYFYSNYDYALSKLTPDYTAIIGNDIVKNFSASIDSYSKQVFLITPTLDIRVGDKLNHPYITKDIYVTEIVSSTQVSVNDSPETIISSDIIAFTKSACCPTSILTQDAAVFYKDGFFVRAGIQSIVPDINTSFPTKVIGYFATDEIITSSEDETLLDPAFGSSNYFGEGADRLRIKLTLFSFDINKDGNPDTDATVIPLLKMNKGEIDYAGQNTNDSPLDQKLAQRTYDESGNYLISGFTLDPISTSNSSNNLLFNISPGKAYIGGYPVETQSISKLSIPKNTNSQTIEAYNLNTSQGNYFKITDLQGSIPTIQKFEAGKAFVELHNVVNPTNANTRVGVIAIKNLEYDSYSNSGNTVYKMFTNFYSPEKEVPVSWDAWAAKFNIPVAEGRYLSNILYESNASLGRYVTVPYAAPPLSVRGAAEFGLSLLQFLYSDTTGNVYYGLNREPDAFGLAGWWRYWNDNGKDIEKVKPTFIKAALTTADSTRVTSNTTTFLQVLNQSPFIDGFINVNQVKSIVGVSNQYTSYATSATYVSPFFSARVDASGLDSSNNIITFDKQSAETLIFDTSKQYVKSLRKIQTSYNKTFNNISFVSGIYTKVLSDFESFPFGAGTIPLSTARAALTLVIKTGATGAAKYGVWNFETGTVTVSENSKSITINLGVSGFNGTADLVTRIDADSIPFRTKTLNTSEKIINLTVADLNYSLGKSDVLSFNGIYKLSNVSSFLGTWNSSTTYNYGDTVVSQGSAYVSKSYGSNLSLANTNFWSAITSESTSNYILDTGARDALYDHGSVRYIGVSSGLPGNVLVSYNNYTHTGVGPITAESYPAYQNIPNYKSTTDAREYSLRDCIDFRPARVENSTNQIYSETVFPSSTALTEVDIEYYIGRVDRLYVTRTLQNFSSPLQKFFIDTGTESSNPVIPTNNTDITKLSIAVLNIPPFAVSSFEVGVIYNNNRRFTMNDIGKIGELAVKLDKAVKLQSLEIQSIKSIVTGDTGQTLLKAGIFVEDFSSLDNADLMSGYFGVSIVTGTGECFPAAAVHGAEFKVVNSDNVAISDDIITMQYDVELLVSQVNANGHVNCNPGAINDSRGRATISKKNSWLVNLLLAGVLYVASTIALKTIGAYIAANFADTLVGGLANIYAGADLSFLANVVGFNADGVLAVAWKATQDLGLSFLNAIQGIDGVSSLFGGIGTQIVDAYSLISGYVTQGINAILPGISGTGIGAAFSSFAETAWIGLQSVGSVLGNIFSVSPLTTLTGLYSSVTSLVSYVGTAAWAGATWVGNSLATAITGIPIIGEGIAAAAGYISSSVAAATAGTWVASLGPALAAAAPVALAAAAAYVVVKYGGDIVEGIGNAISSVGNAIGNAVSSVGHALDPSNW